MPLVHPVNPAGFSWWFRITLAKGVLEMLPKPYCAEAPRYWLQETSGVLRLVIERLFDDKELRADEIRILGEYFRQWIDSPAWDLNPHAGESDRATLHRLRLEVRQLRTMRQVNRWLDDAYKIGVDPL
jgi:hypothetical protein